MWYYPAGFYRFTLCGLGVFLSKQLQTDHHNHNSLLCCFMNCSSTLLKWLLFLHLALSCATEFGDTIMCWGKKFSLVFVLNLLPDHAPLPRKTASRERLSLFVLTTVCWLWSPVLCTPSIIQFPKCTPSLFNHYLILKSYHPAAHQHCFQLDCIPFKMAWPEWCSMFHKHIVWGFLQWNDRIVWFFSLFFLLVFPSVPL